MRGRPSPTQRVGSTRVAFLDEEPVQLLEVSNDSEASSLSVPLRKLRFEHADDRHDSDPQDINSRWEEYNRRPRSPCEISNDPESSAYDPLARCNIRGYTCPGSTGAQKTVVAFEYDVYTAPEVTAEQAMGYLQDQIVLEVAEAIGVDDCRMLFEERRLRQPDGSHRDLDGLLYPGATGLLAEPLHRSPDGAECTSSFQSDTPLNCFPVIGGFSVFGSSVVKNEMLQFVKTRMEDDDFVVKV